MGIGILWTLIFCLETLQGFSLLPSYSNATESKLVRTVARQLGAGGFSILARNQRLIDDSAATLAEFDLIARDREGRLCLIEIKDRINPGKKVERQFNRYIKFLRARLPFVKSVDRVIIVSRSLDTETKLRWQKLGLEFISL